MQKIYCVEDDESVRELVIYALQSSGFEAQGFVNAEEFFPVRPLSYPDHALSTFEKHNPPFGVSAFAERFIPYYYSMI